MSNKSPRKYKCWFCGGCHEVTKAQIVFTVTLLAVVIAVIIFC